MKTEKKYTVKALAVSGSNNKVFKSGDTVSEKNFPPGNADDLVRKGFLIPRASLVFPPSQKETDLLLKSLKEKCTANGIVFVETDDVESLNVLLADYETKDAELNARSSDVSDDVSTDASAPFEGKKFTNSKGEEKVAKTIEDITVKELVKELKAANAEFDQLSSKTILFDLWINL